MRPTFVVRAGKAGVQSARLSHALIALLLMISPLLLALVPAIFAAPQNSIAGVNLRVNFQDSPTVPPSGYVRDFGEPFGARVRDDQGCGLNYGWVTPGTTTPLDLRGNGRNRNEDGAGLSDLRQATFMHMQADDIAVPFLGVKAEGAWEVALPNGTYRVTVGVGDVREVNSVHQVNVENQPAFFGSGFVPNASTKFQEASRMVTLADTRLTVTATGGTNTKINYIDIVATNIAPDQPYVTGTTPADCATNISRDVFISTDVHLPSAGFGVDDRSLTPQTVRLTRARDGAPIEAIRNTSGGGDVIVLQPTNLLEANTQYIFEVDGVKDLKGKTFVYYRSTFTTGTAGAPNPSGVGFTKIMLETAAGRPFTSVVIGPDNKLYAGTILGEILRFTINSDGTLGAPQVIGSLPAAEGGPRALIGMAFDPDSTASNLILWVSHGSAVLNEAPDWSSKISRMSGANLQNVQAYVTELPRSVRDHLTESVVFGPDGALYVPQGSNSGMGAPDDPWGNRPERLLTAAILRIDLDRISSPPLSVKTEEGGTYNPFASNAPVTIYATGVRNAYDLVWHSNGQLYAPTNGAGSDGNTPSTPDVLPASCQSRIDDATRGNYTGPQVTGMTNVLRAQPDLLFRIVKGGYYGHPNPLRCEWVMNGGNPNPAANGPDPAEDPQYPVGTQPDRNWRGFAFNFGLHYSPNGVIEYKSNTFNGALKGKLLVVRYSGGKDIIVLAPGGPNLDITGTETGIQGFNAFNDPLDIVEDRRNGNLYVTEFGGQKITLLRPRLTGNRLYLPLITRSGAALDGGQATPAEQPLERPSFLRPLPSSVPQAAPNQSSVNPASVSGALLVPVLLGTPLALRGCVRLGRRKQQR